MTEASLTPKQQKVLNFITSFANREGYSPSQREIADYFGFKSLGTVQNYLVRLERHGLLKKSWNAKRGMQVVQSDSQEEVPQENDSESTTTPGLVSLPLAGEVAAGYPIEAVEGRETVDVPMDMIGNGDHMALRVKGDSMIEDGILDGDTVIIRKQKEARSGQTVVALIENEATIKRFYKRGRGIELRPANSSFQTMVFDSVPEDLGFKIEGVLVGLVRSYV